MRTASLSWAVPAAPLIPTPEGAPVSRKLPAWMLVYLTALSVTVTVAPERFSSVSEDGFVAVMLASTDPEGVTDSVALAVPAGALARTPRS